MPIALPNQDFNYPPCLLAAQMGLSATPPALVGQEPAVLVAFVYDHFDEIFTAITERRVPE